MTLKHAVYDPEIGANKIVLHNTPGGLFIGLVAEPCEDCIQVPREGWFCTMNCSGIVFEKEMPDGKKRNRSRKGSRSK